MNSSNPSKISMKSVCYYYLHLEMRKPKHRAVKLVAEITEPLSSWARQTGSRNYVIRLLMYCFSNKSLVYLLSEIRCNHLCYNSMTHDLLFHQNCHVRSASLCFLVHYVIHTFSLMCPT